MSNTLDYMVVQGDSTRTIEGRVREFIAKDWSCVGACQVVPTRMGTTQYMFYQTMVKEVAKDVNGTSYAVTGFTDPPGC